MVRYSIRGGNRLSGELTVSGAKNAAIAILPAALLVDGPCRIENVPEVTDVTHMLEILREMGAKVKLLDSSTILVDASFVRHCTVPYDLCRHMRASYYLIGALLGRFGDVSVPPPGGCDFGQRPIDLHIKGFEALGAEVGMFGGRINASCRNGSLKGSNVYLDFASVGATINIIMAAVLAEGLTVIENAAKEPHIVDLANFLNSMGADVKGAGTDVVKIRGRERLSGGSYCIIPDQIEAGTYMACAAAAGGEVLIRGVIPKHLDCISAKLIEMGVSISEYDDAVLVRKTDRLRKTNIKTLPYPGFPTDMQPQATACLSIASGTSMITEGVWDNRYRYVEELKRMGAKITVNSKIAVIEGVKRLTGAPVHACDLRAGAALIVAALSAEGVSSIEGINHIERGYEGIVEKLRGIGADISLEELPDAEFFQRAL